jgi:glucokinase
MLGVVSGDLALTTLPFGGVWLVGGLARAFAPYLQDFGFVEAFRDKGRFSGFMEQFGLGVVEDDNAALTGCASHLARMSRPLAEAF